MMKMAVVRRLGILIAATVLFVGTARVSHGQSGATQAVGTLTGLRYEKMIYLRNVSVDTVPQGKVWQVQAIWSNNDAIAAQSGFMSGFKNDTDAQRLFNSQVYLSMMVIMGIPLHVSAFPFFLESGATVSPGGKGKMLAIAQYRIE